GQREADHGDDGDERVPEGVAPDDLAAGHALGPGRPHVVLAERLEEARPREAHEGGHLDEGERQRGQHGVAEPLAEVALPAVLAEPGRWQQPERFGEEENQHDPQPEAREGDAEERDGGGEAVPDAVAPNRGEDPERNGNGEGEAERAAGELERRAEAVPDERRDEVARLERAAGIPPERGPGPGPLLEGGGAVG